ncbi:2,3,4,5-tetrahydropyridine-2,6-dicarboxylate N-acetyltransferase [Tepiditoga spiralis]|uniref:2,3,4,5-tetrahydropyridine-2,6-dicarboxylate N-acetyltransferase n=1 Tax=Tepiditoga spiralis TaxID=2108365 RepID=A0A7G1G376_9BACT|nr:2,3,4,5-tetrahydropyridine-2,6-dicarboxylate N-acetyltransferase [Tepiditoga spiralis]BBE30858.1 2,3,4,5-tetrahydropyridine-2,6-dicarboxylate N-acetyltransferase [Tepiditoga spiralis]
MNSQEIINYITTSKKETPIKVYLKGSLKILLNNDNFFGNEYFGTLFCTLKEFELLKSKIIIKNYKIEIDRRNSAIPLSNLEKFNARIEPGALIREKVEIGDNAVIMMGAVLNIGAKIGKKTMIDMNAVIGGRAIIGENCHIGAGAVIAGVIEPPSAKPVIIGNNVLVGANAVVLEGVEIEDDTVVAAGAIVTTNVKKGTVVAGSPARVIKKIDETTKEKTKLIDDLRKL